MEDGFGKQRSGCIETAPWRDNRNGVVKIERGWGIGERGGGREKDEGRVRSVRRDERSGTTAAGERETNEMKGGGVGGGIVAVQCDVRRLLCRGRLFLDDCVNI